MNELSVSNLDCQAANGEATISGKATPEGATVRVTIVFPGKPEINAGSAISNATFDWKILGIDLGGLTGTASVEAVATHPDFRDDSGRLLEARAFGALEA